MKVFLDSTLKIIDVGDVIVKKPYINGSEVSLLVIETYNGKYGLVNLTTSKMNEKTYSSLDKLREENVSYDDEIYKECNLSLTNVEVE